MSLFKVPEGIVKSIERILCRFLWGDHDEKRKVHMVAWEKLTVCKEKGGLGIRNLRTIGI